MRLRSAAVALAAGTLSVAAAVHCGGGGGDGGGAPAPIPDAGQALPAEASVYDGPTYGPAAPLSIQDEPDTGCVATTTAAPKPLYAGPSGLNLYDLQAAGGKRVATVATGDGFVIFEADGSGASPSPVALGYDMRVAPSATNVLAAGIDADRNGVAQIFDWTGQAVGARSELGSARVGAPLGVARAGEKGVVVRASHSQDSVTARLFDAAGAVAGDVVLESGARFDDFSVTALPSASGDGSDFLVLWSLKRAFLDAYRVYAALVNAKGRVGLTKIVLGSASRVRVTKAVPTDRGALVLFNLDDHPMVVPVDVLGRLAGPAHLFEGAVDRFFGGGQGLARQGQEVVIVGRHATGAHVLRRLDLTGSPLDGWICLDAPAPSELHLAGVVSDGAGYAVVAAAAGGGTNLLRVDATGRGPLP